MLDMIGQVVLITGGTSGIGLAAAVDMATRRPAELLGLEVAAPRTGSAADFVVYTIRLAAGR